MSSCPCSAARSRCFAAASTSGRRPPPPALARTLPHLQRSRRHHPPLVAGAALPPSRSAAEVIAGVDLEAPGWSGGYGTGGKVWNSARVLCDWLADEAEPLGVRGAAVLELGAGTGLVGVVAAKLGAARVLLTDGGSESLLRLAKDNARRNVDPSSAVVRVCAYGWGPGPPPARGRGRRPLRSRPRQRLHVRARRARRPLRRRRRRHRRVPRRRRGAPAGGLPRASAPRPRRAPGRAPRGRLGRGPEPRRVRGDGGDARLARRGGGRPRPRLARPQADQHPQGAKSGERERGVAAMIEEREMRARARAVQSEIKERPASPFTVSRLRASVAPPAGGPGSTDPGVVARRRRPRPKLQTPPRRRP